MLCLHWTQQKIAHSHLLRHLVSATQDFLFLPSNNEQFSGPKTWDFILLHLTFLDQPYFLLCPCFATSPQLWDAPFSVLTSMYMVFCAFCHNQQMTPCPLTILVQSTCTWTEEQYPSSFWCTTDCTLPVNASRHNAYLPCSKKHHSALSYWN
jgi:hypothetical protein